MCVCVAESVRYIVSLYVCVCLCVCVCVCVEEEVEGSVAAGPCIDVRCFPPEAQLCGIVCQ